MARQEKDNYAPLVPVRTQQASLTLHEPIILAAACSGFPKGIKGTVVEIYPGEKYYAVELFNDERGTLDVVDCHRAVLRSTNSRAE
jgi:hypothetical protein